MFSIQLCALDIARLRLQHLDLRANRITAVPSDLRHMETLEELRLEHNPLTTPPAHVGIINATKLHTFRFCWLNCCISACFCFLKIEIYFFSNFMLLALHPRPRPRDEVPAARSSSRGTKTRRSERSGEHG